MNQVGYFNFGLNLVVALAVLVGSPAFGQMPKETDPIEALVVKMTKSGVSSPDILQLERAIPDLPFKHSREKYRRGVEMVERMLSIPAADLRGDTPGEFANIKASYVAELGKVWASSIAETFTADDAVAIVHLCRSLTTDLNAKRDPRFQWPAKLQRPSPPPGMMAGTDPKFIPDKAIREKYLQEQAQYADTLRVAYEQKAVGEALEIVNGTILYLNSISKFRQLHPSKIE